MATIFPSSTRLANLLPRRHFLRYAGATASVTALALAGCSSDGSNDPTPSTAKIDVGASDIGVLNYAYALEQLETAFYTQLRAGTYYTSIASAAEQSVLDDIVKHEKTHLDFLKAVLPTADTIKVLDIDLTSIDFNTRQGVLSAAKTFEDLGVAAYNGAARYVTSALTLSALGKIVSVEARHAALIRDLLTYNSFVGSDVIDTFTPDASGQPGAGSGTGLELSKTPAQVLELVNPYLKVGSQLTARNLA